MAQKQNAASETSNPPESQAEPEAPNAERTVAPVIVRYSKKKKKKRKRKYSPGLRGLHQFSFGLSDASHRVAQALEAGAATYRKRERRSSRRRRDGAIHDALENWSYAFGKTAAKMSLAPFDIACRLNTKQQLRQNRAVLKLVSATVFPFLS